jgi:hypothetical protein
MFIIFCSWIKGHGNSLCWPCNTLYLQKLALTSPTSGGRLVGIVRLRTKATEFSLVMALYIVSAEICLRRIILVTVGKVLSLTTMEIGSDNLLCHILYLNVITVLNGNLSEIRKLGLLGFIISKFYWIYLLLYLLSTKPRVLMPMEVYLHVVKWLQYYFCQEPRIFNSCLYHHHHSSKYSP